jgi:hypothetical protein
MQQRTTSTSKNSDNGMKPMNIEVNMDNTSEEVSSCCSLRWLYDKLGCHRDRPNNASIHEQMSWIEERRRRVPPRTCTAAILLFTFGTIFVIIGLNVLYSGDRETGKNLLIIGMLVGYCMELIKDGQDMSFIKYLLMMTNN